MLIVTTFVVPDSQPAHLILKLRLVPQTKRQGRVQRHNRVVMMRHFQSAEVLVAPSSSFTSIRLSSSIPHSIKKPNSEHSKSREQLAYPAMSVGKFQAPHRLSSLGTVLS